MLRSPGLGRSLGGLTSTFHLANDCTRFTAVMQTVRVPGSDISAPVLPSHVINEKGCRSLTIHTWLREQGIAHSIPEGLFGREIAETMGTTGRRDVIRPQGVQATRMATTAAHARYTQRDRPLTVEGLHGCTELEWVMSGNGKCSGAPSCSANGCCAKMSA